MQNQRRRPRTRANKQPESATSGVVVERGKHVLLAGASSPKGTAIANELKRRGYAVRALTRHASNVTADVDEIYVGDILDPTTLASVFNRIDLVISTAGAPVRFVGARSGGSSFAQIDDRGNRILLQEAAKAKIQRFAYMGIFGGRFMGMSEILRAQESFIAALHFSDMDTLVVRAAPVFTSFDGMLRKARKRSLRVIGGGWAEVNPTHEDDLAVALIDALESGESEMDIGGPEVLTRREIAELALAAWGRDSRVRALPSVMANYWSQLARFRGRHNKDVSALQTAAAVTHIVAPEYGTRRLEDYFAERVAAWSTDD